MKLPEQDGYYKYYDASIGEKIIVDFEIINKCYYVCGNEIPFYIDNESEGSFFLEPIEPIKFD